MNFTFNHWLRIRITFNEFFYCFYFNDQTRLVKEHETSSEMDLHFLSEKAIIYRVLYLTNTLYIIFMYYYEINNFEQYNIELIHIM